MPPTPPVENDWITSPEFMRDGLVTLWVGCLVFAGVLLWVVPDQRLRLLGPVGGMLLTSVAWWVLNTRGVVPAKQVLGLGGLVVILLLAFGVAGVFTPVLIALPVVLMMIGWLFSPRAARWAAGVSVAALWAMVLASEMAWLPEAPRTTPAMYAWIQTLFVVLTVYVTQFVSNRYRVRMAQTLGMSDELAQRTADLEASQARLQLVIDASKMVLWEYDVHADVLTYDTQRLGVLGLDGSRAPAQMRGWLALVHPEDRERLVGVFRSTIRETGPLLEVDCRVEGVGKAWTWLTVRGAVVRRSPEGRPAVLGGGVVNVQARKAAEAALQASERQQRDLAAMLRSMCDNVPDMIWAKDLDSRYIFANRAICDQLLMANNTDEPLGKNDLFFALRERSHHPNQPGWHTFGELCQDSDAVTLGRGQPSQFEEFGNVKGQMLVLDVHKAPFRSASGEVIGVVGTGRDVTGQKAVYDKLRLASLVLEHSSEALMITDASNVIVEVNPAFTSLTGYSRDEVLGQKPSVLSSGLHGPDFFRLMWESIKAEGRWQGEIWNRRKSGELYAEWLTINTLWGDDGLPYRRVALASDVTENKKKGELLWRQANFDMLTLLPNRRMFQDRLDVELRKLRRSGAKLAVFFMDLDRFKEVNDSLGHAMGDLLLRQAAQRILACVRESDMVARLGGDEFTVILTDIDSEASVERVAQCLVTELSQPFDLEGRRAEVSVSLGIAIGPDHASESAALVQRADQAMYAAKQAGRNGYRFCSAAV